MIKYVKLKEEIEIPCMICGNDSRMFLVKRMKHTDKYSFYVCKKCFKSFKKDMQSAKFKECSEGELSTILKEAKDKTPTELF